jgi:hypothetical protein
MYRNREVQNKVLDELEKHLKEIEKFALDLTKYLPTAEEARKPWKGYSKMVNEAGDEAQRIFEKAKLRKDQV